MYQSHVDEDRTSVDLRDHVDLRAAVEGDLEAYGRIVERYEHVALRAAWLVVRDEAAAEDVCQEAFLRAHRALGTFRLDAPFRPWLLTIVRNLARNAIRARGRRDGVWARVARTVRLTTAGPERSVEVAEGRAAVVAAVAELAADDQDVLHLRYFLDLPEAEVAAVLRVPVGTAKSRLNRARRRLRVVIETRYPDLATLALTTEELDA